jgi:cation transport regulator
MPYDTTDDLPDSVRNNLPQHALEIYRQAFNSAWAQNEDPEEHGDDAAREETAHRTAWAAVKQSNEKGADDRWERRS